VTHPSYFCSMGLIDKYDGFDWDAGNIDKNWISHKVSKEETEEAFSCDPWYGYDAVNYSGPEKRKIILAKTLKDRPLFVVYTERQNKIRPICARDMHRTERKLYDDKTKTNS
jgi:uncharacterized DUF497 family protein